MSPPRARYEIAPVPQPFLILDKLHRTYVRPPLILSGPGNLELGHRVRNELSKIIQQRNNVKHNVAGLLVRDMYDEPVSRYPDGHAQVQIRPSCDQRKTFILQNTYPDPDSRLIEVLLMADAARRAGTKDITAILPYYPYGRGDRKTAPREPIPASLIATLLETAGIRTVITQDIHAEQTTGSIPHPWNNLYASTLFIPELKEIVNPQKTIIMAADVGTMKRATAYKKRLGALGVALMIKNRELNEKSSNPEAVLFVGDVVGKEVVIVDDESVSFSTIHNAAHEAVRNGAERIIVVLSLI